MTTIKVLPYDEPFEEVEQLSIYDGAFEEFLSDTIQPQKEIKCKVIPFDKWKKAVKGMEEQWKRENKRKNDISSNEDFKRVSKHACETRKNTLEGGYFMQIPNSTFIGLTNMKGKSGKRLTFSQLSVCITLFNYFTMKIQKNLDKPLDKQNNSMKNRYDGSCYENISTIKKDLNIKDDNTFWNAIDNLINNGYLCRLNGTEYTTNIKYYFYPIFEANPNFCIENSNDKITNEKNKTCKNLSKKH